MSQTIKRQLESSMTLIERKIQKTMGMQFNKMWETALGQFNQTLKEQTDSFNKEMAALPPIEIPQLPTTPPEHKKPSETKKQSAS